MRTLSTALAVAGLLGAALAVPASADHGTLTVTGLTTTERLVTFTANAPGRLRSDVAVTGVAGDLQSVDFRPSDGALYGVAVSAGTGRLYRIDPRTGAARRVGSTDLRVAGRVSIDVNPDVDKLRVVTSSGQNLRVDLDTGRLAATDARLTYSATDRAARSTPEVAGVAYTENDKAKGTPTKLYDLDAAAGTLLVQAPPNDGVLRTVGRLPQQTRTATTGFDVYTRTNGSGTDWAFVSLVDRGVTRFYELDLRSGAATKVPSAPANPANGAVVGGRVLLTDLAVRPAQGL